MTTKTDIEQQRAEFEAWHTERYYKPFFDDENGIYIPKPAQARWESYQAGRAAVEADRQGRMPSDVEFDGWSEDMARMGYEGRRESIESLLRWIFARYSQPAASAEPEQEICQRCQGNGEIVTDWDRYKNPRPGDVGDEAVAECPDCDGTGKVDAPVAQEPVAWSTPDGREPVSAELKRARPDLYDKHYTVPLGVIAAPAAAQAQPSGNPGELPVVNQQMTTAQDRDESTKKYQIGDETYRRVFKAFGLTNLSDMQAVLDAVESALAAIDAARAAKEQS